MSTLEPKPVKTPKPLNSGMLTIAAILLIVLALLFLASPILGLNRVGRGSNFNRQFNGQNGQAFPGLPGTGSNGQPFTFQGGQGGNGTGTGGNGFRFQGGTGTNGRTFGRTGLLGLGLLRGTIGTIIYGGALLVSLVAVIGMLSLKRWGKILGIVMAVIYLLLSLFSFLPTLLFARFGAAFNNPLGLALNVLHVVLALGVIILASIPARNDQMQATTATPPAAA